MKLARGRQLRPRILRPAFTLVEAIIAAGIVGLMLAASVNLLSSAAKSRTADNDHRTAIMLAHQLMGEIQQQPYKEEVTTPLLFGPEAGESTATRADFDDVDDYNDFQDKPPALKDGTPLVGFSGWRRRVKVSWVDPVTLSSSPLDTGLERVEVRVTDPRGRETVVFALRSVYTVAPAPAPGTTSLLWTGIELDAAGDAPRTATAGVEVVTRPTTPP
jgi:type II secretory pathway pseudopilin PulG